MRAAPRGSIVFAACLMMIACGKNNQEEMQKTVNVAEAKVNLASAYAAQISYFARNQAYAGSFAALGWKPEDGHKYAYFLPGEVIQPKAGGPFHPFGGLQPRVDAEGFAILAVGNIDEDPTLDIWQVDETNEIRHVVDDVTF